MQILNDVLDYNLKIIFCGTAASAVSARKKQYYAGPGNKFWPTLHKVGLTPRQLAPSEYEDLLKYKIGLTDLDKTESGSDTDLSKGGFDIFALQRRILKYQPQVLCFNGKRSAKEYLGLRKVQYGLQDTTIDKTKLFIAPSTSGAASGYWDMEYWQNLANL